MADRRSGTEPATGDGRPATGNRRPATGDQFRTGNGKRVGGRPATGNRRPATGNLFPYEIRPPLCELGCSGFGGRDAARAEALGFESLWTTEHVVVPTGYRSTYPYSRSGKMAGGAEDFPSPDPLDLVGFCRGGDDQDPPRYRHPHPPAAQPACPRKGGGDARSSQRRARHLGVGVGWLEEEFRTRCCIRGAWERTDEYVAVMRALWTRARIVLGPDRRIH